jgi:hypothetical protein
MPVLNSYLSFWDNVSAVVRKLTALNDLVCLQVPLSHFQPQHVRCNDFEVMMVSFVQIHGNIHVAVHWRDFGFQVIWNHETSRGYAPGDQFLYDRLTNGQRVDDV